MMKVNTNVIKEMEQAINEVFNRKVYVEYNGRWEVSVAINHNMTVEEAKEQASAIWACAEIAKVLNSEGVVEDRYWDDAINEEAKEWGEHFRNELKKGICDAEFIIADFELIYERTR